MSEPAAEPIRDLASLFRALGRERSLRGRLGVAARALELLRALSPAQREQVALRIGSQWAWQQIERLLRRDGELDETERAVGRAFERLGESEPGELRALGRALRERDLAGIREWWSEELDEEPDPDAEGGVAAAAGSASQPGRGESRAGAEEQLPSGEKARDGRSDAPPVAPARPAPAVVVDGTEEVLLSGRARPAGPPTLQRLAEPSPSRPVERSESTSAPAPPRAGAVAGARPPAVRAESSAPTGRGRAPIDGGSSPLRVLRCLRGDDALAAELGREGRRRLLDRLGGGWASRRALACWIEQHAFESLDEALERVRSLARASDRSWCLADLLVHWPLQEDERQRVLAQAPGEAARRRLERRHRDARPA